MFDRFDHRQYVSMTMEFRCNLHCEHCMIEGTMDDLEPQSRSKFEELMHYNAAEGAWKGLILTGSEITLHHDLPELARRARESGFEHVRIQTHGMHLSNPGFCDDLINSGIDEYFISVAGSNAETHDDITKVPGSFERTLTGMQNLDQHDGVCMITNTVVTRRSFRLLPEVVESLAHIRKLEQMEFWVYWPMTENDDKDLIASFAEILPYLKQAVGLARQYGRRVEIKNFPECMLGEDAALLVNTQPQLFIDPAFWTQFERNGFYQCVYREQCASEECLGLNRAYADKFGWERDLLHPLSLPAQRIPSRMVE